MPEHGAELSNKCAGCGVKLQTGSPDAPGYVPAKALERAPVVCQRCFRIKHYNEASGVPVDRDDFLRILNHIGHVEALVVHIVDIFDFEGSLIGGLQRFVGNNPVLLVVNKIDLLPKGINLNKIVNWVQKQAKEQGLRTIGAVLCSTRRNTGFERVVEALQEHRKGRDVYVVGATNVGKSTLINRLIADYSDLEAELTVSRYPGTTLDVVNIPLDDGKFVIDTPGIVYDHRLTEMVAEQDLEAIVPEHPIKPAVYQLNERQTLFFGAMARFDFVRGEPQSFTCYVSDRLGIHRTKLERADELYDKHKGELLSPPNGERISALPAFARHSLRIPRGAQADVLISGLGWIKVNSAAGAELDVHAPKGIRVAVRNALI